MAGDEYDFWLFDLDGTVVDVDASYPRSVIGEVGDRLGCPFSEREAELLWYGVGGARSDVFATHGIDAETFWTTFHQVEDPMARAKSTFVYDDAATFLSALGATTGAPTAGQSQSRRQRGVRTQRERRPSRPPERA